MASQPIEEVLDHEVVTEENVGPRAGNRSLRLVVVAVDTLTVGGAWLAASMWYPMFDAGDALAWGLAATALTLVAFAHQRLYTARVAAVAAVEVQRLARAVTGAAVTLALGALATIQQVPTAFLIAGAMSSFFLASLARSALRLWLAARRRSGSLQRSVLLAGNAAEVTDVARLLTDHPELGYDVVGFIGSGERDGLPTVEHLGGLEDAVRVATEHAVTGVVVVGGSISRAQLNRLIRELLLTNLHIQFSVGVSGIAAGRLRPLPLAREPFYYLEPAKPSSGGLRIKRALDILLGSVALVMSFPLWLLFSIAILLEDGPPVLWRQQRVGWRDSLFTMLKFRTMRQGAEEEQNALAAFNCRRGGPLFKVERDPRVTRVGRVLRWTSLDELPQLINVLRGEMSLVGPRPALPEEMAQFDEDLRRRVAVPPGITGLWQADARDNPHFGPYRRLDLYYLENWSLGLDLSILFTTMVKVPLRGVTAIVASLCGSDEGSSSRSGDRT